MSKIEEYYGSTASFSNLYSTAYDGKNDNVRVPDNAAFSFLSNAPFTWLGWFKTTNRTILQGIFGKMAVGAAEYELLLANGSSGNLFFATYGAGSAANNLGRTAPINTIAANDTWYHVACVFTGGVATTVPELALYYQIYVNGVRVDTTNNFGGAGGTMINTTSSFNIGSSRAVSNYLSGKTAAEAMVSLALNVTQVNEDYALGMGDKRTLSFAANLIEAWKFNTLADTDKEGYVNGYDGALTNGASVSTDIPP